MMNLQNYFLRNRKLPDDQEWKLNSQLDTRKEQAVPWERKSGNNPSPRKKTKKNNLEIFYEQNTHTSKQSNFWITKYTVKIRKKRFD